MIKNIQKAFEKCARDNEEGLDFEFVDDAQKLHETPDICALLLLRKLCPSNNPGYEKIMGKLQDTFISLNVDLEKFKANVTTDDVFVLSCCGVVYDEDLKTLCMISY